MAEDQSRRRRHDSTGRLAYALFCVALVLFSTGVVVHQWRTSRGIDTAGAMSILIVSSVFTAALGAFLTLVFIRRRAPRPERERVPVCTHCFRPHVEEVHFCPTCSRPLTFFAATGPFERVYAQMWALGKAAHHPTRRLHVVGVVVIAASTVVGALLPWISGSFEDSLGQGEILIGMALAFLVLIVMLYVYLRLLELCLRNWHRYRRESRHERAASSYGHPPWWTHDREWALPDEDDGVIGEDEGV